MNGIEHSTEFATFPQQNRHSTESARETLNLIFRKVFYYFYFNSTQLYSIALARIRRNTQKPPLTATPPAPLTDKSRVRHYYYYEYFIC